MPTNEQSQGQRNVLLIISGPSGVGKGTIASLMLEKAKERGLDIGLSVSMTTRDIRPGEKDGETYCYVTQEQFKKALADGEILEYNCYNGNYYGTPASNVRASFAEGHDVLLEIDINGADQIVKKFADNAVTVFILPPSIDELEKRLRGRGRESEEDIRKRLRIAEQELERSEDFDYSIINDKLDTAAEQLIEIYLKEKSGAGSDGADSEDQDKKGLFGGIFRRRKKTGPLD